MISQVRFGQKPVHFGAVELVQQDGAPHDVKLSSSKEQHTNWETHDVVSLQNKRPVIRVSQAPNAQTDIKLFNGKGGLSAIIATNDLRMVALPGSHIELPDTILNMPGSSIHGSDAENDSLGKKEATQKVTKQAMILGGGFATRFEPVSGETTGIAKPAVPLGPNSVIVDIAKNLYNDGIRHIVVNTYYLPGPIEGQLKAFQKELKAAGKEPLKLSFLQETKPLGTAGGLVDALKQGVIDQKQPLMIVQGDAVTDADFSGLLNAHKEHGAKVTIATKRVDDKNLKDFGFVVTDRSGNDHESGIIETFVEKPGNDPKKLQELKGSRLANTGIYIFSPEAYPDFIKRGKNILDNGGKYDYGMDFLTPLSQERSSKQPSMWAERMRGYWADIGNPSQYIATFKDILGGKLGPDKATAAQEFTDQNQVFYWPDTRQKVEQAREKATSEGTPFNLGGNIVVANAPKEEVRQ